MTEQTSARRGRGRPPGPPVDQKQRRAQLLDAAEIAIRKNGPDVGLADIAAAAGLTRSAVYASFDDRTALLNALAARHARRIVDRLIEITGSINDPAEQTRGAIDILAAWFEDEPELAHALSAHMLPVAVDTDGVVIDAITAILTDGFVARGRDATPAATWSRALVGAISTTITWWSATRTISREQVVDHLFMLFWSGFAGLDPPAVTPPRR